MTARGLESDLLDRCVCVALGHADVPRDQKEANVFHLAAMVVSSRFPNEAKNLSAASHHYFAGHPGEKVPPAEVVRNGWVVSLPRLRDLLFFRLSHAQ